LVERVPLDAVVIATPVAAHVDDACVAAAAGVAVLVEKPPAPDAAGARALMAITPEPWVGFNRRFDPGVQRVRAAVPRDGDVDLRLKIFYRRKTWRAHSVCDDALLDLGPHLVDWAGWITSSAVLSVSDAEVGSDRAVCTLLLARGRARIVAECDRPYREVVELRDASGQQRARHAVGGLAWGLRARVSRGPHPLVATLAGQLHAMARAVRGEGPGELATAGEAATVMAVVDAARASAGDRGRLVRVGAALDV
jgi:myo-inositol 2-dehydrogenase / D-chiro-inositol 1-dehydrogenase